MTKRERDLLERLKEKEREEKREQERRQRIFKEMCKEKFGLTPTELAKTLEDKKSAETADEKARDDEGYSFDKKLLEFARKISTHYSLYLEADLERWLSVMLNEQSRKYWMQKRDGKPAERRVT